MRRLVATVLRRLGTLRHLLGGFLEKGFPSDAPRVETILLIGAAQILWLDVPDHAAVDLSVRLAQADRRAARYAGLVNAVLRRVARDGARRLPTIAALDTPKWLMARWTKRYGAETARAIAAANGHEPALDLTVKYDAESWAERAARPRAADRHGAHHRAWRDLAAAGLRRRRLVGAGRRRGAAGAPARRRARQSGRRSVRGARRQDRAARAAGARVTAVDRSAARLNRLRENLARLALEAETVAADALEWQAGPFDAVLLDAPCSSTGTIRRHPDMPWLKSEADIAVLTSLQQRLLDRAVDLLKPGGTLVYCVCSLEPEEGEDQIAALLARDPACAARADRGRPRCGHAEFLTADGDLRTLPPHLPDPDPRWGGLDGFYAARLIRN